MADIENIMKDREINEITIFGAMFPLYVETSIIKRLGIARDEEEYADYLHSLQCMDAYYAIPLFYQSKTNADMPFGNYAITSETDTIFPVKPLVPPFVNDPKTGKPLECSLYAVSLYSYAKKQMLARVSFEDFCRMADIGNCEKHDRLHVILKGISEERLAEMAAEGCHQCDRVVVEHLSLQRIFTAGKVDRQNYAFTCQLRSELEMFSQILYSQFKCFPAISLVLIPAVYHEFP